MLNAEYREKLERAFWTAARDKRIPPATRLTIRFQAGRFRALARRARKIDAKDEPSDEILAILAKRLKFTPEQGLQWLRGRA